MGEELGRSRNLYPLFTRILFLLLILIIVMISDDSQCPYHCIVGHAVLKMLFESTVTALCGKRRQ